MACLMDNEHNFSVSIPSYEMKDNVTYYKIDVIVGNVTWSVSHRYNNFAELHDILVSEHCFTKELLPQKKYIGNKDPEFIEKRRQSLEIYLRSVVSFLQKAMPTVLLKFLEFDKYDITYIVQELANMCFNESDYLQQAGEFNFNPLQLYAISERLKKPCPQTVDDPHRDFSHILEFCGGLMSMSVRGGKHTFSTSNVVLNSLPFELTAFKSLRKVYFYNVQLSNIRDLGTLRQTVSELTVYNSGVRSVSDVLLCDTVHKCDDQENVWPRLTGLDLSWNEIGHLEGSAKLVPNLESLTIDGNALETLATLEFPCLTHLCMSANRITVEEDMSQRLRNVVSLNLSQNRITQLKPFAKMTQLKSLNLESNLITDAKELRNLSEMQSLDYLVLSGNPVSTIIDYRVRVFEYFINKPGGLCLDNEQPSQKELDTAAVLKALTIVKEGRPPITTRVPVI